MAPLDCARFASAAAAISTTGLGGQGALPTAKACRELMSAAGAPRPTQLAA
jgi:sugar/nucleoside kinase (ribokinase family)